MAIPRFETDLEIISKLGDNPGSDNNLTTDALRRKFDEAPLLIQEYINDVLIPEANAVGSPNEGLNMKGPINMNGQKLSGVPVPEGSTDAVNLAYFTQEVGKIAQVQYVEKTLTAGGWVESDTAGFAQTVKVEGLTDAMKCRAYPAIPATLAERLALAEETPKVKACSRSGSSVTFEAWEEKPEADIPVIVEVMT